MDDELQTCMWWMIDRKNWGQIQSVRTCYPSKYWYLMHRAGDGVSSETQLGSIGNEFK